MTASPVATEATDRIAPPPVGRDRLAWFGPGFLWMVSAAGSGELLFTPRIGSLYGYALVWALLGAVAMKWFINREIGRYTVCTGRSLLDGFHDLPGPKGWATWLIVGPQLVVAVATLAGLAGSAATALVLALPGDVRLWTIGSILASTALVALGRYTSIERVATAIAIALGATSVVAAVSVFDSPGALAAGVRPQLPEDLRYDEVLPWLGFMLSGAAGMIWYSFWLRSKGYGAAGIPAADAGIDPRSLTNSDRQRVRGWLVQMTIDNTVAVVGTLVITVAFLVLGVELLRPEGLVPEENRVAEVLGELLGGVWGRAGFWFMVVAVFVGFWDTVLSDQDGFGRMFARAAHLLGGRRTNRFTDTTIRRFVVVVVLTVAPIVLYLMQGEPVALLKLAGAIEAAHIPVLAALTLHLNRQALPADLRPSNATVIATSLAGVFFAVFAVVYLLQVLR